VAREPSSRPDAILAANDLVSIGVLQAASLAGMRLPDDLAIIGYDDIDFAATATVPLTSMRQPAMLIGHTAVDLLLGEAQQGEGFEPKQIVYQPELVVRQSTSGR
jgi:LacI family transcriptional regulator